MKKMTLLILLLTTTQLFAMSVDVFAIEPYFFIELALILSLLLCILYARRVRKIEEQTQHSHQEFEDSTQHNKQEIDKLRAMLDAINVPVWYRNKNFKITDCNRAYMEIVEAPKKAIIAEGIELVPSGSHQLCTNLSAYNPTETATYHTIVHGQRHLIEVYEKLYAGHYIGFGLDASALEAEQRKLKDYLASQSSLLENLSTAIAVFDASTRLQFFNQSYCHMTASDESWLRTGPTLAEILEDQRTRRQLPEYVDFMAFKRERLEKFTALMTPEEELVHRPDGRTWRMITAPYPMGGLMHIFEDVTDKLSLEREYNTLLAVKQAAFNNLYEGIAVFGSNHRLKFANPAFTKVWQLPDTPLEDIHLNEVMAAIEPQFIDAADCVRHRDLLTNLFNERRPSWGQMVCNNGRFIDFKYVPLPDGAHLLDFIDVTDQHKVEQALRERNEALVAADELKSQFIMHVSYELRTPLNTIIGFAEILLQKYFGALNVKQMEYVQGIHQSSQQLLKLINDILDLTTIESEHFYLEIQEVNIENLLHGLELLLQKRVYEAGLEFIVQCAPDLPLCYADERRLRQALYNLVSNSLKFTPAGGRIALTARLDAAYLVLAVEDTGVGVEAEDQVRIFDKFERGSNVVPNLKGAGLGLALVKTIIEHHGGYIRLESTPGVGTQIQCYLPLNPHQKQGEETATVTLAQAG